MLASPAAASHLLVLWDVDHTLIETRGVGRSNWTRAYAAVTGKPLAKLAAISGRTELDIMAETLRINGIAPTEQIVAELSRALALEYDNTRDELRAVGGALPGAQETLASLAADTAIHQSVLTGNLREVARIKLEVFDLARYLDLNSGAYGDDDPSRPALVAIAQQRALDRTGLAYGKNRTVLVGDTPKDVEAGLAAGVHVIGIATGKTSAEELRDAGAPVVANNLDECSSLINGLLDHPSVR